MTASSRHVFLAAVLLTTADPVIYAVAWFVSVSGTSLYSIYAISLLIAVVANVSSLIAFSMMSRDPATGVRARGGRVATWLVPFISVIVLVLVLLEGFILAIGSGWGTPTFGRDA